jgi:type I restriction enzyme S subunit
MSFPMVALGDILTKSDEWIDINPNEKYRQVKVRLWGKGVMLRDEVSGAEIAASKRLVVHPQQFIVSRIDARNGAFGLIPDSLEGAVVSSDFPVFTVNPSRILPKYLNWMSKTHFFVDLCKAASEGTTNRVRLKEDRFLATQIPLPIISEQSRIVARIEEIAAKIEEARGLRKKAGEEGEAIMSAHVRSVFSSLAKKGLYFYKLAAEIANGQGLIEGDRDQAGEYAVFGSGGQVGKHNDALMTEPYVVIGRKGSAGKVTFASEGGWVTDTAYYAFPRNPKELECKYLFYATKSLDFTDDVITTAIPGINRTAIYAHKIPLPPLPEQRRIVTYLDELQAKVDALRRLQAETGAELDALMPAVLDRAFKGEL